MNWWGALSGPPFFLNEEGFDPELDRFDSIEPDRFGMGAKSPHCLSCWGRNRGKTKHRLASVSSPTKFFSSFKLTGSWDITPPSSSPSPGHLPPSRFLFFP
ncbi:hypothetical protein Syun_027832 [Stephania yunnanensis]|uniref:Uncharacterized protein n=1 Tax=Stephania yunnanensis TaxID=152371 RepID=A0AAP0EGB1_9MAGN